MANGSQIASLSQAGSVAPEIDLTARSFEALSERSRSILRRRVSAFRFNSLIKTDVVPAILDVLAWFHAQAAFYHDRRRRNSLLITADTRESMVILTRAQGYRMRPATSASVALTATPLPTQAVPITIPAGTVVQAGDLFFELVNEVQIPAGVTSWPDGTTDDLIVVSEGRTIQETFVSDGESFQKFELGQPGTIEGSVRVTVLDVEWDEVASLVFIEGDRQGRDTFTGDGQDDQSYELSLFNAVIDSEDEDGLVVLVQPAGSTSEGIERWQQVDSFTGAPREFVATQDSDGLTTITFGSALAGAAPGLGSTITVFYLIVGAQRRYQLTFDSDDRATIQFGDGVFGLIPPNGATIEVTYRVGGGVRGNVDIDSINTVVQGRLPNNARVPVRLRNLEAGRGGEPPETVEHARFFAPRFAISNNRAVRGMDWTAQAATFVDPVFGAPAHASAFLKQKVPELNTVQVALWSRDVDGNLTTANTPLKVAVKKHLDSKRTITTNAEIIDGEVVFLNIEASIVLEQGAIRQAVFANARTSIERFFNSAFVLPGVDLSISRLYDAIQDVEGVESVEITKITGARFALVELGQGDGTTTLFSGDFVLQEGTAVVGRSLTVVDVDGGQQAVDDGSGGFTGDNDNTISVGSPGNSVTYDTGEFSIQLATAPPTGSRVFATAFLESFFPRVESIGTSDGNVSSLDGATDFFPIVKRTPRGLWAGEQNRIVDGFQIGDTAQMAGKLPRGITPGTLTIVDSSGVPQSVSDNGSGALLQGATPVGTVNYNTGDISWTWNSVPVPVMRASWETDTVDITMPDDLVPLEPGRVFVWAGFDADGAQTLGGGQLLAADDGEGAMFGNVDVGETAQILYENGEILFTWNTTPPPSPGSGPTFTGTLTPAPDGTTREFAFSTGADLSSAGSGGEGRLLLQTTDLATPGVEFFDSYDNFNGGIDGESIDREGVNNINYAAGSGTITFKTPPAAGASSTFAVKVTNVAVFLYAGWVFRVKTPGGAGLDKGLFADQTGRLWGPPAAGSVNPFPQDRLDHLRGRFIATLAGSPIAAGRDLQLTYDSLTGVPPALDVPVADDEIASLGQVRLTEKAPEVGFGG